MSNENLMVQKISSGRFMKTTKEWFDKRFKGVEEKDGEKISGNWRWLSDAKRAKIEAANKAALAKTKAVGNTSNTQNPSQGNDRKPSNK